MNWVGLWEWEGWKVLLAGGYGHGRAQYDSLVNAGLPDHVQAGYTQPLSIVAASSDVNNFVANRGTKNDRART